MINGVRVVWGNWQRTIDRYAVIIYQAINGGGGPSPALALAAAGGVPHQRAATPPGGAPPPVADDGFLWAVPKYRRSVERRMMRRYGAESWPNGRKLIKPKNNLIFCLKCGSHYLPGMLCMTCYNRVKSETEELQKAVAQQQGLTPPDREVAIVYRGEREAIDDQQAKAVRLVELPKERPRWFSKNLMQRTTTPVATETAPVKPSDLG
ncbi:39S ribosomal protein L32, mitochondrial [Amphibalanus amphitrite]|uniref:Large ribosomal subunit protein bL32m n=1 Tax=Amphibalanus amphitrite TaxID=1232801 RepID=A0A6A4WUK3_AMPAM|nr:39S ribosomal protein L32, mitochondrial-like [Amphibalanus amphitrite]KAF0305948.1 39S ribosomal protein L32, mitochondrial [Amphibalanus amphitrite]